MFTRNHQHRRTVGPAPRPGRAAMLVCCVGSLLALVGCSAGGPDARISSAVQASEFGLARDRAASLAVQEGGGRGAILNRMRLITLALADGAGPSVRGEVERLYDDLRTQGLNADRTLSTIFIGEEGSRIYKGEPFEQAMAYHYVGVYDGMQGDWGSTRAAATNSLFLLRDFSKTLQATGTTAPPEQRSSRRSIRSQRFERTQGRSAWQESSDAGSQNAMAQVDPAGRERAEVIAAATERGDFDYSTTASDFELGYVMRAISATQINEPEDAKEALATLRQIAPRLSGLADQIAQRSYNTVLVVEAGIGPEKIATGPSGAIAAFRPRSRSDDAPLRVWVGGTESGDFPVVTDLNRIATSLKWANLEDLRVAKSTVGDVLILGGAAVAVAAEDDQAKLAGAAAVLAGLALQATSRADTRQNEALPQRVYVALVNLPVGGASRVELDVQGIGRLVLPAMPGPEAGGPNAGRAQLRYVRMPQGGSNAWATSGTVLYGNDATGPATPNFPWILGGRDLRTPTWNVLKSYHDDGYLRGVSVQDLIDLYKDEGIQLVGINLDQGFGRHVLEGGRALYTPDASSAGFARLYGTQWPEYVPRSERNASMRQRLREGAAAPN